jgi:hypothetical protein
MDRFLIKRPLPPDAGTSRPLRLTQVHAHISSVRTITPIEINLDNLPPDPADRKIISQYTKNPKKQDDQTEIFN